MTVRVKRVYWAPALDDGQRILVDRLWPRGLSREQAHVDLWLKEVAPSEELRQWFGHDPERWKEFRARYFEELASHPEPIDLLVQSAKEHTITLLFGAKDEAHNNAVALAEYLRKKGASSQVP